MRGRVTTPVRVAGSGSRFQHPSCCATPAPWPFPAKCPASRDSPTRTSSPWTSSMRRWTASRSATTTTALPPELREVSESVRAVIVHYGPYDLARSRPFPDGIDPGAELLGPHRGDPVWVRLASPVHHVAQASAPVLLVHGTGDVVVSSRESVRMHAALEAAGKPAELLILDG